MVTNTETKVVELIIEELRQQLAVFDSFIGRGIKHKKTNGFYVICGFFVLEVNLAVYFLYETRHDKPIQFARPVAELVDGRFEFL